MPTIRGSKLGSKKRYAGLKSTPNGDELIFKGLETVRSDWTPLAKSLQTTLYTMIFSDEDASGFLRQFVVDTRSGKHDDQLIYRKRLRRPLKSYVKNVPPHVKAARMADEINQSQGKQLRYQNKGHISYIITTNGPEAVENRSSPIDYNHYIEKQIRPIAEGILPFIDVSYDEVVNAQFSLL
jgi:DNA polymerase-2